MKPARILVVEDEPKMASLIGDFGRFETHEAFVARLRARHGRKTGFWALVADMAGTGA